jgi:hypothetical protein
MGLKISYRGQLRDPNELDSFLDDVYDICIEIGWHFMPIHRSNVMPTKGVMITPAGSEPIWLTFLTKGKIYDPAHFIYTSQPELESVNEEHGQWVVAKTQYAGVDTHMAIIKFFRYLSLKYFESFELRDDSQYWETNDEAVCLDRFNEFNRAINILGEFLDSNSADDEDDFEDDEDDLDSASSRMDEALMRRGGTGVGLN